MRRLLAVGLITVLLVALIPASGTAQSNAPTTPQKITTSQEFDDVEFHIFVYKNSADALWTFRYEKTLNNKQEREQFKEFSNRFNSSDTEMYKSFRENAVNLTRTANNRTKRKMAASNFSKNAYINQEGIDGDTTRGVVEMSFTWSSFAYGSGNVTNIGDVFKGGLYLGKDQTLVINHADGMTFEKVRPTKGVNMSGDTLAESSSVSWTGPREFTDQHPMVKFSSPPQSSTTTTTTSTNNSSVPPGGGNQGSNSRSPMMWFIAVVLVLIGLVAVFMWRQGSLGSLSSGRSTPGGGGGGAGAGGAAATPESNTPPAEPAVSDEELLTDEARVKKLLRENGGRMKQVNIVDETGWSKSKVSMLLSEMEEEGDISKLRVGRENIISLDGHEPDAAGSPLDR
ncbi:hypothetical protein A4G99_07865 [Haladaptatus sp. R4]|uniref:helix-turn-helix transcriptional regulator n=1 Tax=Haladaptatus sp. R4 TaxID=1679489 RepID=UPI0007B4F66D|nr:transcriptional regulator [Haladaptatus sp. R4]KZN24320.1 hypothetical protein A4G99_07865 [Haladaptatus sp. R4]